MLLKMSRERGAASFVIFFVLLAAMTVLFYQMVYVAQRDEIEEKRRMLLSRQQDLARLDEFSRRSFDGNASEEALQKHTAWSRRLLPDTLQTGDFLSELQGDLLRSHVKLVALIPHIPEQKEGFCRQRIELTVEGDYFQMLAFIHRLEQKERFLSIDNLFGQVKEAGILCGRFELYIFARRIERGGAGK